MNKKIYIFSYLVVFLSLTLITKNSHATTWNPQNIEEVVEGAIKENETAAKINLFFDLIYTQVRSEIENPKSKETQDRICKEWRELLQFRRSLFHDNNAQVVEKLEKILKKHDNESLLRSLFSEEGLSMITSFNVGFAFYEFQDNVSKINPDEIEPAAKRCFEDCIKTIVKHTKTITLSQLLRCIGASVKPPKA